MKTNLRQQLLASTLLVGAFAFASPAMAQDTQSADPTAEPPSGPVEAQPTPAVSAEGEDVQGASDIIVTGSRIPQPNLESAAPVSVVSDQDVKLSGAVRVEDIIGQLPSAGASQNAGLSNSATGTAELDLRYLGAKRTLSLVNGRRLVPGDPNGTSQAADINLIPAALIKRAEVLTGGASSVYGADAVAGVVNFIMDTHFEGIRFDGNYSFYWHQQDDPKVNGQHVSELLNAFSSAGIPGYDYPGNKTDGGSFDGTVTIGSAFDDGRGHAVAYFGYRKTKAVLASERDFSVCQIAGSGQALGCGGSATAGPQGNYYDSDFDTAPGPGYTLFTFGPGQTTHPGYALFNYNPYNYFQRPDERYVAGAFADYEITPALKPYLEFMFMDDHTLAQIAPSGDFGNTFTVNCDNPFLGDPANPDSAYNVICQPGNIVNGFLGTYPSTADTPVGSFTGAEPPLTFTDATGDTYQLGFMNYLRRNVEGGPRISDLSHTTWRGVLGTRGDLNNWLSYDAYFQYGRNNYSQVYRNEFSVSRLNRALNAVFSTDTDGDGINDADPVCRSVLDQSDINCVPFDFSGTPSAAAVNYLNVFGVIHGVTSEQVANANATMQLGEVGVRTPWAEDGVALNVGVEYRKESLTLDPDQSFQTGDLAGQGAPTLPVDGSFRVYEAFGEVQIPIAQHSWVDDFSIGAGYRRSGYNLSNGNDFSTNTYKLSLEFAPISDIRLRASYNRAVRAPNIQELFAPQFVGLDGGADPCSVKDRTDAGLSPTLTAADAGCIAQFMAAGIANPIGAQTPSNPAAQYNGLLGGNPDLEPEKASTKTFGVVLQPRFLPRFALTVDYWNIKVKGAVQGFGADAIVQDCIDHTTDPNSPAPSCALIHRNPAGSLWLSSDGYVIDTPNNVGGVKTNGIDVNAAYSHPLFSAGKLSWSFLGTYTHEYITDNGLTDPYDCAGFYGSICSGGSVASAAPIPHWKHKARVTWTSPWDLGLSLQWRMVGSVDHERTSSDSTIAGNAPVLNRHIDAQHYFDLSATYDLLDRVHLRAGINNLLDNDPPLITTSGGSCPAASCNVNTYPGTWDTLGRYVWMGATIDFAPSKAPPPPPPPPPPAPERG